MGHVPGMHDFYSGHDGAERPYEDTDSEHASRLHPDSAKDDLLAADHWIATLDAALEEARAGDPEAVGSAIRRAEERFDTMVDEASRQVLRKKIDSVRQEVALLDAA